jgi:Cysteine rich repeat
MRALFLVIAVLGPNPVLAQAAEPRPPNEPEPVSDCRGDIEKYCRAIQPGGGRIVRCLIANKDNLTPGCKAGIVKAKAAFGL